MAVQDTAEGRAQWMRAMLKDRGAWAYRHGRGRGLTCDAAGCDAPGEHVIVYSAHDPAMSLACGDHLGVALEALRASGVPDVTIDRSWRGVCPPIGGA